MGWTQLCLLSSLIDSLSPFFCHLLCWTHLLFLYVRTMLFMCGLRHMFLLWMSKDFGIHDIGILGILYGWDVIYSCSMVWHLHLNLYFIMSHWYANVYMCCNCLHSYVRGDYYLMCAFAFKRKLLLCTHLGGASLLYFWDMLLKMIYICKIPVLSSNTKKGEIERTFHDFLCFVCLATTPVII